MGPTTTGSDATAIAAPSRPSETAPTPTRVLARVVCSLPDLLVSALAGFALPTMVLLLAGRFSPGWVFPFGLIGAALAVAVCGLSAGPADRRAVQYTLIAVGLALLWLVVNSFYSAENLFAHRDPATYNLAGRWLMDHAGLHIPAQASLFGSPPDASVGSAGFGRSSSTELYAQGNHLLPALLAVAGWMFGTGALLKANVAFGALALFVFFGLARRVVGARLALLAMVILGVSMPLIFVSRDTYSEPLALLFLTGGLALLHRAVESGRIRDFALAGFVLATSVPARIDSNVSLLAVLITAAAFPAFASAATRRIAALRALALVGGAVVPTLIGWLDVSRLSFGYYRDERHHIVPILYVGYALLVVLPLLVLISWHPRIRGWLTAPGLVRRLPLIAGVLIIGGFAFLASRPLWMVTRGEDNLAVVDLQRRTGDVVDGARTYNEQTVHWLSQYLGWPVVVLGAVGYVLLIRRCLRTGSLAAIGTITVGLAMSLLYLWGSQITPDQPWAMRRYVPVVLPVLIIAAVYTLCVLLRQRARTIRVAAVLLGLAAIAVPAAVTAPMATAREEVPQLAQVDRICAKVAPDGAVLTVDPPAQTSYSQTVRSYCNVPSIGLVDAPPAELAQVRTAVASHRRVLYLMSTDVTKIRFAAGTTPSKPFSVVKTTRWPSVLHHPPTGVDHEQVAVYLATVRSDGLAVPVAP
ncbi:MAG TPA: glycosyltransferase family 39 protein [Jatrophihabitantaceae bacterium]